MPANSAPASGDATFYSQSRDTRLRAQYSECKQLYSNLLIAFNSVRSALEAKSKPLTKQTKTFIRDAFTTAIEKVKVSEELEDLIKTWEKDYKDESDEETEESSSSDEMSVSEENSTDSSSSDDTDDSNLSDSDFEKERDSKRRRIKSHAQFLRAVADFNKTIRALAAS